MGPPKSLEFQTKDPDVKLSPVIIKVTKNSFEFSATASLDSCLSTVNTVVPNSLQMYFGVGG